MKGIVQPAARRSNVASTCDAGMCKRSEIMGEKGFISLSILEELWSYLKGVMELEGVKELSHYSVLTFFSRVVMELFLRS